MTTPVCLAGHGPLPVPPGPAGIDRNPFLRGPCFITGQHHACAGIGYQWPAPSRPEDPVDRIRWTEVVFRCPCRCGHPERATAPEPRPA